MPWTIKDVDRFKQGLTPGQKKKVGRNRRSRNGSDCEAYAIRVANSTVGVSNGALANCNR